MRAVRKLTDQDLFIQWLVWKKTKIYIQLVKEFAMHKKELENEFDGSI